MNPGTIDRKTLLIRPRPFMYGGRGHPLPDVGVAGDPSRVTNAVVADVVAM